MDIINILDKYINDYYIEHGYMPVSIILDEWDYYKVVKKLKEHVNWSSSMIIKKSLFDVNAGLIYRGIFIIKRDRVIDLKGILNE